MKPGEAGKGAPPKGGAAFRETLWFRQGDVEQMVADAKAKMQATGKAAAEGPIVAEDARPLEDRYVDDGSVTVEDRKKFSLRTGGTSTAIPTSGPAGSGREDGRTRNRRRNQRRSAHTHSGDLQQSSSSRLWWSSS